MLGRNATIAFRYLHCQGQAMTTMIDDILKILFTTETSFILTQRYVIESTISCIQNCWMGVKDNKVVSVICGAQYEKSVDSFEVLFSTILNISKFYYKILQSDFSLITHWL